jgi:3-oxoacyl-[acyl-carrier protein] reductase
VTAQLAGKTAIVTGAGGGIGRATADALARLGAALVVNDIGRDAGGTSTAERAVDEIRAGGGRAAANTDSVTDWDGAARMVELARSEFGSVDILVNNAGIASSGAPWDLDAEAFDRVVSTHVQGSFYCARHALGPMREQGWGRIVNLVSRAGITGMPNALPYAVGKGGVFGLTNGLSRDVIGSGITVNAVNPASTGTPMVASLCLPAAAHVNGQIFLVEHNRIGLFQPLTVTQQVEREEPWTADALCEALGELSLQDLADAYS